MNKTGLMVAVGIFGLIILLSDLVFGFGSTRFVLALIVILIALCGLAVSAFSRIGKS